VCRYCVPYPLREVTGDNKANEQDPSPRETEKKHQSPDPGRHGPIFRNTDSLDQKRTHALAL
jgi:hypothetical protein